MARSLALLTNSRTCDIMVITIKNREVDKMRNRKPTEDEVLSAISTILEDKKSYDTSLNWAVAYCKAALSMEGETLRVQCLYILSNITHWRHPEAKRVRETLKAFSTIQ